MSVPVEMQEAIEQFLRETAEQIPSLAVRIRGLFFPLLEGASNAHMTALAAVAAMAVFTNSLIVNFEITPSMVAWASDTANKLAQQARESLAARDTTGGN